MDFKTSLRLFFSSFLSWNVLDWISHNKFCPRSLFSCTSHFSFLLSRRIEAHFIRLTKTQSGCCNAFWSMDCHSMMNSLCMIVQYLHKMLQARWRSFPSGFRKLSTFYMKWNIIWESNEINEQSWSFSPLWDEVFSTLLSKTVLFDWRGLGSL